MSAATRGLLVLGGMLAGLTLGGVTLLDGPNAAGADYAFRMNLLVGLMMMSAAVYFAAVWLVLRRRLPGQALWLVLGVAVLLRVVLLASPPLLSTDIFRYVWDGRVQAAGINPYRYLPVDPALAALRDESVFPHINRANYARTIYPPMAQLVFAFVGRVWDSVTAMKLAMVGFEVLGVACLLRLLPVAGLPRERILIYAWNPLALWSFAGDGHVDAVVVGLLGLGLLLRARRQEGLAGAVLGCATLVKFFPLVVAPAFARGGRLWRPALAGGAVIVLLYGLYSSAGRDVLGFLPFYGSDEGLANGSGFWLLASLSQIVTLPAGAAVVYAICAATAILCLAVFVVRRGAPGGESDAVMLCRDTALLAAAAMVAISPHYPWYFAWLALPSVVAPSMAVLWLSAVPQLLYLDPWPHGQSLWPSLVYLPAAALLIADVRQSRAPSPSPVADLEGKPSWPLQQH